MIGGFIVSLMVFGVGAILDFAVTVSPYQSGFNINNVGVILMIIGAVGAVVALVGLVMGNRHRVDSQSIDSQGKRSEFHEQIS